MVLLTYEAFLTQLNQFFTASATQNKGSVFITQKPHIPRPTAAKPTAEPGCLYRATFGKKKASAFVTAKDVPKFLPVYSSIIRSGMSALKRSKKAKKGAKKGEE